jgi:3',5'-cyclic AMP phosphodiesterase CpdA
MMMAINFQARVQGHDGDHPHKVRKLAPSEAYAPGLAPDRVVLNIGEDPMTTANLTWRTSTEVREAWAEIAEGTHGPEMVARSTQLPAASEALLTDLNTAHFHSVKLRSLKPGTCYSYRVGDGENWSEWFQFRTASEQPQRFSFLYFGDAQNDILSMWSRVVREAYREAPKASFMIHAGDLINTAQSDGEWGEWFRAGSFLHASMFCVPVAGNHEQAKLPDGSRRLSHHWRPSFTLPENGVGDLPESCYHFQYGNALFLCLNSNEKIAEQAVWMEKILSEKKSGWVICTFHHPIFSTAKDRDNRALREAWKPIFDRHRVDLVLQGHDHTYGRTALVGADVPVTLENVPTGLNRMDGQDGTVYVVSVSGPKMYNLQEQAVMNRSAEDTQLFQIIEIDGDRLTFEARTAIGDLYDGFTLTKEVDGRRKMTVAEGLMPERRRESTPAGSTVPSPQPLQPNAGK